MEVDFEITTYLHGSNRAKAGDKKLSVLYGDKSICCQLFKEIADIKEFLKSIRSKLLSLDPNLKIEDKLNIIRLTWLEENSKLKEGFYGKRAS